MRTSDEPLVRELRNGLPRVRRPYDELARRLGVPADDVLARLRAMKADGRLRRMAAVVNAHRVGIRGNVMVVWNVPEDRIDEAGRWFAARPEVTHAYRRAAGPEWPYRLYTMVHAPSEAECVALVEAWARELALPDHRMLPTVWEWKKSSPVYFVDADDAE